MIQRQVQDHVQDAKKIYWFVDYPIITLDKAQNVLLFIPIICGF